MSEIQNEAYSEALDEIERLEQLNDDLIADKNRITEVAKNAIAERDVEIAQLKTLLASAADALEETLPLIDQTWNHEASARSKLIDELRKAAR
jgi:hypothetical protein